MLLFMVTLVILRKVSMMAVMFRTRTSGVQTLGQIRTSVARTNNKLIQVEAMIQGGLTTEVISMEEELEPTLRNKLRCRAGLVFL
jgi:hypothetical protein